MMLWQNEQINGLLGKIGQEHYHEVTNEPMVNWHRDELVHEHTPGVGSLHHGKQQTHQQLVPRQMIIGSTLRKKYFGPKIPWTIKTIIVCIKFLKIGGHFCWIKGNVILGIWISHLYWSLTCRLCTASLTYFLLDILGVFCWSIFLNDSFELWTISGEYSAVFVHN